MFGDNTFSVEYLASLSKFSGCSRARLNVSSWRVVHESWRKRTGEVHSFVFSWSFSWMKTKWVFQKLSHQLPPWLAPLVSPFRTQKRFDFESPFSDISTVVFNHVDISVLLSCLGNEGLSRLGSSIHASVLKIPFLSDPKNCTRDVHIIWNSLLGMYWKCGEFVNALKLFDEMPVRDSVSWNTMISGFLRSSDLAAGFDYFKRMRKSGFYQFDQATLTTVLSACNEAKLRFFSEMMHGLVVSNGYECEISVGNALITSYFNCHCLSSARQVFDEMVERNVISWTAVISGHVQNELYEEGLKLFSEMRLGSVEPNSLTYLSALMACSGLQALDEGRRIQCLVWKLGLHSNKCTESVLMDMFSKCGCFKDAWQLFESAKDIDAVSVTIILTGFVQNGYENDAIQFFVKLYKTGLDIDPNMVSAVLGVFGEDTSLSLGQQIHSLVIKKNFGHNNFVGNGLINMYAKCGALGNSAEVFTRMCPKNSISWNSMIAAYARHGDGHRALQLYEEMRLDQVKPTDVTFLSLLHACSHVGLVEKGMEFLRSMIEVYGIRPRSEHYACFVDMLGRAGLLSEAKNFIQKLPGKTDILLWQALLGACSFHGNSEMGEYAANQLQELAPESPVPYVLMANIYSSSCKWQERARTIKRMREMGVAKDTGISWIEIEKKVHSFVVDDRMHQEMEAIYTILAQLLRLMFDEGYVPGKRLTWMKG